MPKLGLINEFPEAKYSLELMPTLFVICDSLFRQSQYILKFLYCLALLVNWGTPAYPKPKPIGLAFILCVPRKGFKVPDWDVRTLTLALFLEGCLVHITKFPSKSHAPCAINLIFIFRRCYISIDLISTTPLCPPPILPERPW